MFAALGASLAADDDLEAALRMAMAAGCLNATRHGLGTGTRQEIEQLSRHVRGRRALARRVNLQADMADGAALAQENAQPQSGGPQLRVR